LLALLGDPTKAKEKLGWVPEINVRDMCKEMVKNDLKEALKQKLINDNNYDND
jgi:GDPmannose 4,6-dehydratase